MPSDGLVYIETWEPEGFEVKGRTAALKYTQLEVWSQVYLI